MTSGEASGDEMDSFLGRRGERILLVVLGPVFDVRWFELKSDSDEILFDNRELVDRGLVGGCCCCGCGGGSGSCCGRSDGSSRTREERSVNGLLIVLLCGDWTLL